MTRALLVCAMALVGCTGSLESARKAGTNDRKMGLVSAPAGTPERCSELDDRRQFFAGGAKVFAVLAGGAGLSTVPLDDPDQRDLRTGVAIGGVVAAAVAAGAMVVADGAGTSWGRECSGQ